MASAKPYANRLHLAPDKINYNASNSSLKFLHRPVHFLTRNQLCQSTEGN